MKRIISTLIVTAMLVGILPATSYADEVTQTVLKTMISDTTSSFYANVWNDRDGTRSGSMTTDMSYNGTSSYRFANCQAEMIYHTYGTTANIVGGDSDIQAAVDAGTAYICGWFYYEPASTNTYSEAFVYLIYNGATQSDRQRLMKGQWTFYSAKITNLADTATKGTIDTRSTGAVYVDDLCVISTSDGSAPVPTERTYTIKGASFDDGPNRYGKVLRTIFNGVTGTKTVGPGGSYTQVSDIVKDGYNYSWKFGPSYANNLWYLSGAKEISTDATLSSYVAAGNLYWTAWMCMSGKSGGLSIGGTQPGNNSNWQANEWFWVCIKISSTSEKAKWLDTKSSNTVWLTDIKLMAFEDDDIVGLNIDSFDVSGIASASTVTAGSDITGNASVFNNSSSNEDLMLIVAEYTPTEGELVGLNAEYATAKTYRITDLSTSFSVSSTSGNKIKAFLWKNKSYDAISDDKTFTIVSE